MLSDGIRVGIYHGTNKDYARKYNENGIDEMHYNDVIWASWRQPEWMVNSLL